jgi:hypothetical protein
LAFQGVAKIPANSTGGGVLAKSRMAAFALYQLSFIVVRGGRREPKFGVFFLIIGKLSLLQNPVGFAQVLAVSRPTAYETCFFQRLLLQSHPAKPGEPEVLQQLHWKIV